MTPNYCQSGEQLSVKNSSRWKTERQDIMCNSDVIFRGRKLDSYALDPAVVVPAVPDASNTFMKTLQQEMKCVIWRVMAPSKMVCTLAAWCTEDLVYLR